MKPDSVSVSPAAAARLPLYIRSLKELAHSGVEQVCSRDLAEATGLEAHQIRKDLSRIGNLGKRGVGYQVDGLIDEISTYLRLSRTWRVALIGYGRLGAALAAHLLVSGENFRLAAVFDCSARKIGARVGDLEVMSWKRIPQVFRECAIEMAIITTPPLAAQGVAELAVEGGVRLILNFAPISLNVPTTAVVRNVDLATEMLALSLQLPSKKRLRGPRIARPTASWASA